MNLPEIPDVSKTLEELDGQSWGEAQFDSHLVLECHRLRRVPLSDFTPANFRILIGQNIDLEFLVPLALRALTKDPLLEADYYPGDLLRALLRCETVFWRTHSHLRAALASIVESAWTRFEALDEDERGLSVSEFKDDLSHFQKSA